MENNSNTRPYCYGCEYCQEQQDQQGWWFHMCTHPVNNGRFCGELKSCPIKRKVF